LLLSASASPPTVLIQDLRLGGLAAVQFKPTESTTAVTCAAFEVSGTVPSSADANLLLGFRDGTLALFRVCLPVLTQARGLAADFTRTSRLQIDTVGVISGLHKASMGGVTATAFVPGYSSRAVSIGCDGRCKLVDFEEGGQTLRT
jgi:hypothetical protein